jgi:hypothetical protein
MLLKKIDNPLDIAKNQFLGVDVRRLRKKRVDKYEHIKELELKNELRKGSTLLSYSED